MGAVTIASSVGASMSAATGRPGQGHIQYAANQGAWWTFYLTSTNQLSAKYSSDFSSWNTPTGSPITLTAAHSSEGRNYGLGYANIAGVDIAHLCSNYLISGNVTTYHSRYTLGTTITATNAEASIGLRTTYGSSLSSGGVSTIAGTDKIFDASPYNFWGSSWGSGNTNNSTNADAGSSWTAGYNASGFNPFDPSTGWTTTNWLGALGSTNVLYITDDAGTGAGGTFKQLDSSLWNGTTWGAAATVLASSVTEADTNAWGSVVRTSSDVHVVALSNNSNSYVHRRFNGTSWSAGNTIPTLAYGTNSGIALATDGTNVWAFVFDTSKNLQVTKWNGTSWSAWSVVLTETNTPAYLTCYQNVTSNNIGLAWTSTNGANFDIRGDLYSTGAVVPQDPASIWSCQMMGMP